MFQHFQLLLLDKKYVFSTFLPNPLITTYFICPLFYPPSSHIHSGTGDKIWDKE